MARRLLILTLLLLAFGFVSQASVLQARDDQETAVSTVVINEILVSNASVNLDNDAKQFSDWIELYNTGSAVNIGGYYLSDDPAIPFKYRIPDGTWIGSNSHILFWADDLNYGRHTNFKLNHGGETVLLHDNFWTFVDSITYDPQLPDISYGRQGDGNATWAYFGEPSPDVANSSQGILDQTRAPQPLSSVAGGFHTGSQNVDLSTPSGTAEIRYTVDGSIPTPSSTLFTTTISISATAVLRARVFDSGVLPSETASQTYLIDETSTLPVVSLATNPENFWDEDYGIYADGNGGTPNWEQDWERPVSVEFYLENGDFVFQQDTGVEIHGGWTRQLAQKSLGIRFRDKYGPKDLDYQLFPDKSADEFRSFILRNGGSDIGYTRYRDPMMQNLIKDQMDIDYQANRPAIVFLNGQYWGHYNIREKLNDEYLETNYGVDPNNIDFIEDENEVKHGDLVHYQAMLNYIVSHDMNAPGVYDYVRTQMDVDEFMNYQIAEIYVSNTDWPGNNLKYWRPRTVDGRWRWIIFDTDYGFGWPGGEDYTFDSLSFATSTTGPAWPNPPWSTLLLRELLKNDEFEAEFMQRFASHINISFDPARVLAVVDAMKAELEPEMPRHIARWGFPSSLSNWHNNINVVHAFGNERPSYMRTHIDNYFGNPGTNNLTVNIVGEGDVFVSSVKVPASGYSGPYFKNVPMQLEAVPALGYEFVEWQETADPNAQSALTINTDTTITAVFSAIPLPELVINELHYNPSPTQGVDEVYEFLEIYNAGDTAVALDDYRISDGVAYTFTVGTSIAPDEYIVVSIDSSTYSGNGYQVFQWTSGKLANSGETVALSNDLGHLVDQVMYGDGPPWVTTPDGDGPSLSLVSPELDNSLAINWVASDLLGGTPGAANSVSCMLPATAPTTLGIAGAAPDGVLSWTDNDPDESRGYEIWESETAVYFQPADSGTTSLPGVDSSPYMHTNAIADAANHFYRIRSINRCMQPTAPSNLVGIFKFEIEPGQ